MSRWPVEALYAKTLGRTGDAGGVDYWANTLDSGQASRYAVVPGFSKRPEHQSRTAPTIGGEQPDQFGIKLS